MLPKDFSPSAKPYVYFEERRQRQLESCRERVEAGVKNEGTPPDAVSAVIEHALFDENPRTIEDRPLEALR